VVCERFSIRGSGLRVGLKRGMSRIDIKAGKLLQEN
jgi:hypothetical protein